MDFDAPLIELDATADLTDTYVYQTTDDGGTDDDAGTRDSLYLLVGDDPDASPFALEDEDEFLFGAIAAGSGKGTAAPDSSTPAPPAEQTPTESDYQRELREIDTAIDTHWARHSALRSTLLNAVY